MDDDRNGLVGSRRGFNENDHRLPANIKRSTLNSNLMEESPQCANGITS